MERLAFHRSRVKNFGLALMGLALVAAFWFMLRTSDDAFDRLIGWFGVVFFGLAIVIGIKRALKGGVAFVLDRAGITLEEGGIDLIPWSEVESCSVITVQGTRFLSLSFREPEQFLSRVSPSKRKLASLNESMGWGHWALSFAGVSPGIDEALSFIRNNVPHVQAPAAGLDAAEE